MLRAEGHLHKRERNHSEHPEHCISIPHHLFEAVRTIRKTEIRNWFNSQKSWQDSLDYLTFDCLSRNRYYRKGSNKTYHLNEPLNATQFNEIVPCSDCSCWQKKKHKIIAQGLLRGWYSKSYIYQMRSTLYFVPLRDYLLTVCAPTLEGKSHQLMEWLKLSWFKKYKEIEFVVSSERG